ncbi:hypothetical protein SOVF_171920, partial [Spinacia oleracea]
MSGSVPPNCAGEVNSGGGWFVAAEQREREGGARFWVRSRRVFGLIFWVVLGGGTMVRRSIWGRRFNIGVVRWLGSGGGEVGWC